MLARTNGCCSAAAAVANSVSAVDLFRRALVYAMVEQNGALSAVGCLAVHHFF